MIIDLDIKNDGYISTYVITDRENKYMLFQDIMPYILKESKHINKVIIRNKDMIIKTNELSINIKNHYYNKNTKLDLIIEKAFEIRRKEKREYLRKRKINRIKTFTGVTILSLGLITSNVLAKNKDDNIIITNVDEITYDDQTKDIIKDQLIKIVENKEDYNNVYVEPIENKVELSQPNNIKEVNLEFENRTNTDKFINTKNIYYNLIKSISKEYGIDPQIMLAIATQESGKHTINENGPALGLMQIELSVWDNQSISAYNYNKQSKETIKITKDKLKDLEFNIRIACMHFQNCLINSNYDLLIAVQMYNYGYGNIEKLFKAYYNQNSLDMQKAIINSNEDWINYRNYINQGDRQYLEHVFSYVENLDKISCKKIENHFEKELNYKINNKINQNLTKVR